MKQRRRLGHYRHSPPRDFALNHLNADRIPAPYQRDRFRRSRRSNIIPDSQLRGAEAALPASCYPRGPPPVPAHHAAARTGSAARGPTTARRSPHPRGHIRRPQRLGHAAGFRVRRRCARLPARAVAARELRRRGRAACRHVQGAGARFRSWHDAMPGYPDCNDEYE